MSAIYFVSGTGTDVGKTVLTRLLVLRLRQRGVTVRAFKPICSGGRADARALWSAQSRKLSLPSINPWWFAAPVLRPYVRPWRPEATAWAPLKRTLRIGIPIGTQFFFESFAFGLTALFMGWMGTASLAGHEIALNMAAMTFMVPLGISGAAAAVVGHAVGRNDMPSARRDALAAIVCALAS